MGKGKRDRDGAFMVVGVVLGGARGGGAPL
jgi:hypothetical protein